MNCQLDKRPDGATLRTATFTWDMQWTPTHLRLWLRPRMIAHPHVYTLFAGEPDYVIALAARPEMNIRTLEVWEYIDWLEFMESLVAATPWSPLPASWEDLSGDDSAGDLSWLD